MLRDVFSDDPRESSASPSRSSDRQSTPSTVSATGPEDQRATAPRCRPTERTAGPARPPETLDTPRAHYLGDRAFFLRDSELHTLAEIGAFRAVAADDLARLSYGGDSHRMERETLRLKQQSLLTEKVVRADRKHALRLFAVTKKGARLAKQSSGFPEGQVFHHGFVKSREAKHDADLYRMYHAEAERIAQAGGRITRIVLDYELKRTLNRELASLETELLSSETRERLAERHGLTIVDGKIPVPDMRIEYDSAELERQHLDLELATRNYRPRALAEKAKAGFSFYAPREDAPRLRRVLDQREITAEILSL